MEERRRKSSVRRSPPSCRATLLLERGVDVSFLTATGRLRGSLVSRESRNVYLRLAQFDRWKDAGFRLAFSRQVVAAKLGGQLNLLGRAARSTPGRIEAEAPEKLRALLEKLDQAETVDQVRGLEGAGAAVYYGQFARLLTTMECPGRKKHPATDPPNALLSLGYVMLSNEVASLLEARGFDPAVGFLHGIRYGRQSFSLDVVEPFRQPVIDRLTLRLLNRRQFQAGDFEGGEQGIRLHTDAFKEYLAHYEDQLRSASEGPDTPTWRERLSRQVAELKDMVMSGEAGPMYTWSEA